jgi:zinc D-Ala-D-Ala carboxypeptidase
MQLSKNFSLAEFTTTSTGLPNDPSPAMLPRFKPLAAFMEKVRHLCGDRSISVHSAYRSPAVNAAVGGVPNSAHAQAFACDFSVAGLTPYAVAEILDAAGKRGELVFDQLILEQLPYPTWVHISRRQDSESAPPRMQRLTKLASGAYVDGIVRP